jgi:type III secretion protein V
MFKAATSFARFLSRRTDMIVALIVVTAVIMMIIPLPTFFVDIVICLNIAAGLLILLVGFYITSPMQFSSLPAVILMSTVFRLAITITTTRLILLQADAGDVVATFGNFVIGGNVAVGLVIFFIITVAQFVVITKGGERVAEVAARFSLDAMPGKQMAIDNELRNGDITQAEARVLRRGIERESHLYGAMDGAMKFVKGDAIAGIIIILVNLIGGLAVGMAQRGMSFADAISTYSLLTVGDGLVSQIPALLVSLGAGTVVTRVATDEKKDLGTDIIGQLASDFRALYMAGAVMIGLSLVPGFPTFVLLFIAAMLIGGGAIVHRRNAALAFAGGLEESAAVGTVPLQRVGAEASTEKLAKPEQKKLSAHAITIKLAPDLDAAITPEAFYREVAEASQGLWEDLGIRPPAIDRRQDTALEPGRFSINFHDVPVAEGGIQAEGLSVTGDPINLDLANIPYERGPGLVERTEAIWVNQSHREALERIAVGYRTPVQVLHQCLAQMLRRYAPQFIGIQETRALLAEAEAEYGDLIKEAQGAVSAQRVAEVLRRLLEENVPVRNLRLVLEALVEYGPKEKDVVLLVEYVRMTLGRQICFRVADRNRVIGAYILERSVEDAIRAAVRSSTVGSFLNVPEATARSMISQFRKLTSEASPEVKPAVVASMDVRRHLRNLLVRNGLYLPVLSYQELTPEFSVQPLATIVSQAQQPAKAGSDPGRLPRPEPAAKT